MLCLLTSSREMVSSEKPGSTLGDRSTASTTSLYESVREQFSLHRPFTQPFYILLFSVVLILLAAAIRSAVVLSDVYMSKMTVADSASDSLDSMDALETLLELLYLELHSRVPYLTRKEAQLKAELNQRQTAIDSYVTSQGDRVQNMYYRVPEYKQYKCSLTIIRSNNDDRADPVRLFSYRTLEELSLNPWNDTRFYQCIMEFTFDVHQHMIATAVGFNSIWSEAVGFHLALRAYYYFRMAVDYAYVARETGLKYNRRDYDNPDDRASISDAVSLAQGYFSSAKSIVDPDNVPDFSAAFDALNNLATRFFSRDNITAAALLVDAEKFDPSSAARDVLTKMHLGVSEYRDAMTGGHDDAVSAAQAELIGECVKLGLLVVLLPLLFARGLWQIKNENIRLHTRYDGTVSKFEDASKAIFRLLPESVARKLNLGLGVKPEFFHNVTVFFSDIVGFTTISAKLSASEVLAMLNHIYTIFDSQTKVHKCYKVETIGDAYVVASGVPVRNTTHSAEIAALALVLVEEVGMIRVQRSNQRIQIRVGLNSGPVMAGIVGSKMLRYCLFGKTVLYANKMEQTSKPQRIQVSQTCYKELIEQGGFIMQPRPVGEFTDPTYWLDGRVTSSQMLALFGAEDVNILTSRVDLL